MRLGISPLAQARDGITQALKFPRVTLHGSNLLSEIVHFLLQLLDPIVVILMLSVSLLCQLEHFFVQPTEDARMPAYQSLQVLQLLTVLLTAEIRRV